TTTGARLSFDLFGSVFFMITRYEELVRKERDTLDRFPASASVSVREGFINRPVVNEWVEVLWAACCLLWPWVRRRTRTYSVLLSHDVDEVSLLGRPAWAVVRTIGADLLMRREPAVALRKARSWRYSLQT